jgi:hypothetical protein
MANTPLGVESAGERGITPAAFERREPVAF